MAKLAAVSIFGLLVIGLIVIVVISLIVYTKLYNAKINRQLQQGITNGRQWPKPETVVLIVFGVCVFAALAIESTCGGQTQTVTTMNDFTDYVTYTSDEIKGTAYEHYTEAFETGELTGYKKIEKTENGFHYMYFVSQEEYDILHPAFILFVKYVGDEEVNCYMDHSRVHKTEDTSFGSSGGGDIPEYHCVIGNMDFEKIEGFSYTVAVFEDIMDKSKVDATVNGGEYDWSHAVNKIEIWID